MLSMETDVLKLSTVVFALALAIGVVVSVRSRYAEATPRNGCGQWAVQTFMAPGGRELAVPEGWEPFAGGPGVFTARRCIRE